MKAPCRLGSAHMSACLAHRACQAYTCYTIWGVACSAGLCNLDTGLYFTLIWRPNSGHCQKPSRVMIPVLIPFFPLSVPQLAQMIRRILLD